MMRVISRLGARALLVVCVFCSGGATAQSGALLEGELGRWLQGEALPELATLLGKHPRFRGERIRIVPMRDGIPRGSSDHLTDAVIQQLTHRLTRVKGVQLAWTDAPKRCGVPRKTPYLLGVDVAAEGRTGHRVQIAMVDVLEGVWVSGAHMQWRGRLASTELAAHRQISNRSAVGTVDKPVPEADHAAVLKLLVRSVECSLEGGLDGALLVRAEEATDALTVRLARSLRGALVEKALVAIAEDKRSADWVLSLSRDRQGAQAVVATLIAATSDDAHSATESAQRLAEVYIRSNSEQRQATVQSPKRLVRTEIRTDTLPTLIAGMHQVSPKAGERCFAGTQCAEIEFELLAPAYLLVLRTRGAGHVSPGISLGRCSGVKKTSGTKRYRISAEDRVGFYALATTDPVFARALQHRLASIAGNCSSEGDNHAPASDGFAALDDLLERNKALLHWRAHYVSSEPSARERALAFQNNVNE